MGTGEGPGKGGPADGIIVVAEGTFSFHGERTPRAQGKRRPGKGILGADDPSPRKETSLLNVADTIRSRRSVKRVTDAMPPKADIEAMLEAATYAPNHHMTEPWRFFVLTGEAREQLGDVFAQVVRRRLEGKGEQVTAERLDAERRKPLRAPVIIAVVSLSHSTRGIPSEELQATAAAIQNMLLTAHARGLGAIWRTGGFAYEPEVKAFFGVPEDADIAGFIYVGCPAGETPAPQRTPYTEKTTWMGLQDW